MQMEKLRTMSDEELAYFIIPANDCADYDYPDDNGIYHCPASEYCKEVGIEKNCVETIAEWLKMEAE